MNNRVFDCKFFGISFSKTSGSGRASSRLPSPDPRVATSRGARRRRGWDGLAVSLSSFLYYWPVATRQPYLGPPPSPGPSLGSAVAVWLLATEQKPLDGEREEQQGSESEGEAEGEARHKGRREGIHNSISIDIKSPYFQRTFPTSDCRSSTR